MNKRAIQGVAFLLIIGLITACGSESNKNEQALEGLDYLVTIKTDMGEMKAILYNETPQHKANFLKLVNEGFYDSLLFHRVMQGFMIQGGDPNSKNAAPNTRLGRGGPGYTVPAEFVPAFFHEKGALSAARQPDGANPERASSGSQFYIVQGKVSTMDELELNLNLLHQKASEFCANEPEDPMSIDIQKALLESEESQLQQIYIDKLKEHRAQIEERMEFSASKGMAQARLDKYSTVGGAPFLDENYTVFGQVIYGLEVIDAIAANAVDPANRPIQDIVMYISVEEISKKDIAEKYGNPYIQ